MPSKTILIVEDEKNILELLKYNLERENFKVLSAMDGETGLELALQKKPSLIILDLMLPKLSGLEVCKIIRQNQKISHTPILMLTAKGEEVDKILGLQLGADDYVTKPFSPSELVARIKAVLRRSARIPAPVGWKIGALEMDPEKHRVTLKNSEIYLTSKEYDLLKALLEAGGKVLSREDLLSQVWKYENPSHIETRTIDMHIRQLRKKLHQESERIMTVKNVGYRMRME
ncbi:MAG: response regulator transcription factor [Candidatus Omnitrophica bacterium]|nr:response regulator transcription factor [Candidatus Omnitrophota bacterium]